MLNGTELKDLIKNKLLSLENRSKYAKDIDESGLLAIAEAIVEYLISNGEVTVYIKKSIGGVGGDDGLQFASSVGAPTIAPMSTGPHDTHIELKTKGKIS